MVLAAAPYAWVCSLPPFFFVPRHIPSCWRAAARFSSSFWLHGRPWRVASALCSCRWRRTSCLPSCQSSSTSTRTCVGLHGAHAQGCTWHDLGCAHATHSHRAAPCSTCLRRDAKVARGLRWLCGVAASAGGGGSWGFILASIACSGLGGLPPLLVQASAAGPSTDSLCSPCGGCRSWRGCTTTLASWSASWWPTGRRSPGPSRVLQGRCAAHTVRCVPTPSPNCRPHAGGKHRGRVRGQATPS